MSERLNKYLALHMGISRRQADDLITGNKVTVGGEPAVLGARVNSDDRVMVSGKLLKAQQKFEYLALNKPVGYVCSRRKQGDSQTIYAILPKRYHNLKPVGRLDKDSSGLILLTNDGNFAYQMTHPKFYKTKVYQVSLNKPLEPLHQQMISDFGIQLPDGPSKLSLELRGDSRKEWTITMHQGRNRQIRRTFSALGYTVVKLHRHQFGNYRLDSLPKGEYRTITAP